MNTGPLAVYRHQVDAELIAPDRAQARAAGQLQRLHDELKDWRPGLKAGPLRHLGIGAAVSPPEGLYFWGDVGRGKSMLMDLFFEHVPIAAKRRVHFHAFMAETHERIFAWRQAEKTGRVKGSDPIGPVARDLAREAYLLCFDEFQVNDIADASILDRLFTALFDLGVVVVATSNIAPDRLYEGGLNRQRFLPFIELIKERMMVASLEGDRDYRLGRTGGKTVYHTPLGPVADQAMDAAFREVSGGARGAPRTLKVKGHRLDVPCAVHGVARFSFDDLCAKPLGASDYLKLAELFDTVVIDHVPVMSGAKRNEAKRFVTLIDALYEHKVRVILSAEAALGALYEEGDGAFAFQRTVSRLNEMQSEDYLAGLA